VVVPAPDVRGRLGILQVHAQRTTLAEDVDLERLARGTSGFSGAELENVINEAALLAARGNKRCVEQSDLEMAKDKVAMGNERRSLVLSDAQRRRTAYHEAGHALVARMMPESDPVNKITIVPRGMALGLTQIMPSEDRYGHSRTQLTSMLAWFMGGRAAEELVFNEISTGASNDIKQATRVAHGIVCEYGMSEALGPVAWGSRQEEVFLGKDFARREQDYSEATAERIDAEVRRLVQEAYDAARDILARNDHVLHKVAQALLERETIDGVEFERIVSSLDPVFPETTPHVA
jgi:cell division protease FtsH